MRTLFALCVVFGLLSGSIGCHQKSEVTKEKTVTTPQGSTTTTESKSVKQSGENPPPASATEPSSSPSPNS